ncbi:MAG: hypothetical protein ACHQJ6_09490, partial [Candidatus Berkiellales bacterium]
VDFRSLLNHATEGETFIFLLKKSGLLSKPDQLASLLEERSQFKEMVADLMEEGDTEADEVEVTQGILQLSLDGDADNKSRKLKYVIK